MFVPICTVSHTLSLSTKQLSLKSAGGDVLHHLGSKTESYVYRSLKFQVNYEVPLFVRPILSVDMLTRKGVWSCLVFREAVHSSNCLMDTKIP